jgi:hypothetical protein
MNASSVRVCILLAPAILAIACGGQQSATNAPAVIDAPVASATPSSSASAASTASVASAPPPAPSATANTVDDDLTARGNMWGDAIGDSFGAGGLYAVADGGAGGGIGLGSIGTLGHGAGTGTSQGFGGRSGSSSPTLRQGATQVNGRLPPEVIQRIVRQNFGRFRLCYENGLRTNPKLDGRIAVKFVIDKSGAVKSAADGGSTLSDPAVVSCVVGGFKNLSFPQPESGEVTVVYPIIFAPGDPPAAASASGSSSAKPPPAKK